FFRDILKYRNVDVGGGWLVFALPPGEVAVHPSDENDVHEFYLMCDDVTNYVVALSRPLEYCATRRLHMTLSDRIEKQITLRAPVSKVWNAIARAGEFGRWFGVKLEGEFTPGQPIRGTWDLKFD